MAPRELTGGSFVFDPDDPDFDRDPNPTYDHLRAEAPVYWWPKAHGWVVSRYDDVVTLLTDSRFSAELRHYPGVPEGLPDSQLTLHQRLAKHGLFWMVDVDHARVRRVSGPLFSPRVAERFRPSLRRLADDVLDGIEVTSTLDVAAQVAAKYPLEAIIHVLGIPRSRHAEFRLFGSAVIDSFYPSISSDALQVNLSYLPDGVAMVEELLTEREGRSGRDFLSQLVNAERHGERLTRAELLSMVALMISAGSEPPRHLINFTLLNLLRRPGQLAEVRRDPALVKAAIEESYRFDGFGKLNLPRFPLEDVRLGGVDIAKGDQVFGIFASALRDARVFPQADRFDLRRDLSKNLMYGDGPHVCLGRWIAQVMVEVMVQALLERFPTLELAGEPQYVRDTFFRKMVSLPTKADGVSQSDQRHPAPQGESREHA
ncbi:cytochrome P450 [Kribbella deserti]|uniref:Cytochrome P450 n=1 Tax=Kribbella deserti TaxID=1926257 RepID=A0ABV6QN14_9ACTN